MGENKHNDATPESAERTWVVACIDGSRFNSAVCDYSVWLSNMLSAPFQALHAIEHSPSAVSADLSGAIGLGAQHNLLSELTELEQQRNKLEIQKGRQMLDTVRERAIAAGLVEPMALQRHGSLVECLMDIEAESRVIVLGVRGELHEANPSQLGGHLETLVRSIHRPIFVVSGEFVEPQAAMLAYDASSCARKALAMVKTSPLFEKIPLHVVHVNKDKAKGEALVAEAIDELALGDRVISAVLEGEPVAVLCDYQQQNNIGLTAMGAFSHSRLRELMFGSFTQRMLQQSEHPLVLLR